MKSLILFFSYSGNTKMIASKILEFVDADLVQIEPIQPYSSDYDTVDKQVEKEVKAGFEPEIIPLPVNPADYDTIYIGTPVWWYTIAPPIRTLLRSYNWQGKTICPFATHGGARGSTFRDVKRFCAGADVKEGLDIYFSAKTYRKDDSQIKAWLEMD